jgi:hypothetical protein
VDDYAEIVALEAHGAEKIPLRIGGNQRRDVRSCQARYVPFRSES